MCVLDRKRIVFKHKDNHSCRTGQNEQKIRKVLHIGIAEATSSTICSLNENHPHHTCMKIAQEPHAHYCAHARSLLFDHSQLQNLKKGSTEEGQHDHPRTTNWARRGAVLRKFRLARTHCGFDFFSAHYSLPSSLRPEIGLGMGCCL